MTARPATTRHGGALRWLAGVLLLGVLTACGSAETSGASGASGPEIRDVAATSGAFDNGGLAGPTSSAGASAAPAAGAGVEEQKLARTGTISLQVTDIGAATAKVRAINVAAEGITISENIGSYQPGTGNPERAVDPSTYAVLVISVPVAQLERTLDSLQAIGKVLDRRTETQNFTSGMSMSRRGVLDEEVRRANPELDRRDQGHGPADPARVSSVHARPTSRRSSPARSP